MCLVLLFNQIRTKVYKKKHILFAMFRFHVCIYYTSISWWCYCDWLYNRGLYYRSYLLRLDSLYVQAIRSAKWIRKQHFNRFYRMNVDLYFAFMEKNCEYNYLHIIAILPYNCTGSLYCIATVSLLWLYCDNTVKH